MNISFGPGGLQSGLNEFRFELGELRFGLDGSPLGLDRLEFWPRGRRRGLGGGRSGLHEFRFGLHGRRFGLKGASHELRQALKHKWIFRGIKDKGSSNGAVLSKVQTSSGTKKTARRTPSQETARRSGCGSPTCPRPSSSSTTTTRGSAPHGMRATEETPAQGTFSEVICRL